MSGDWLLLVSCFLFRGPMWSFRAALLTLLTLLIGDGIPPLQTEAPLQNFSDDGIPPLQRWSPPQNFRDAVIPPPSRA